MTGKRRLRIEWTCSDFATHHRHRWHWSAWLCGRAQWLRALLVFVLFLIPAPSWAQKPTVIISGDGSATVVSVGTQGPPGANIPAGGSEGQGVCKSGGGLGWCSTFLCAGGNCSFSVPLLVSSTGGIAFLGEPTTKIWRNLAGTFEIDFLGISGMRLESGVLRLLTASATIYGGAASDVQLSRDAASTWQLGADAAAATAQTLKGPDSSGAGNPGGNLILRGGSPGAGGSQGNVEIGSGSQVILPAGTAILGVAADNCSSPPFSFSGQTTSGFCSSASGTQNIRVAGVNQYSQTASLATFSVPVSITHDAAPAIPLLKFDGDGSYGDFNFWSWDFDNAGDPTRKNRVYRLGYNVDAGGGFIVPGEPSLSLAFESYYAPDANRYAEGHLVYGKIGGGEIRPVSFRVDRSTNDMRLSFNANILTLYGATSGLPKFQFSADMVVLGVESGAYIRKSVSPDYFLQQMNAAGTVALNLIYQVGDVAMIGEPNSSGKGTEINRKLSYANQPIGVAPGAGVPSTTIDPTHSSITLNCQDTDGCDFVLGETDARTGVVVTIINISANVCNFADTPGVSELAGVFAMGQYDSLSLIYVTDRWVETARSGN